MAFTMEGNNLGDLLKFEQPNLFSREAVTVLRNRTLAIGTVLGRRTKSSAVAAAGTNTGGGSCDTVTLGAQAMAGVYALVCTAAPTAPGVATPAAYSHNTGTGTCGTVTVSAGAKIGVYTVEIDKVVSNAGAFIVRDPDGIYVGEGNVASAFSAGGLAFTIADATDFIVGDGFTITVAPATSGAGGVWNVLTPQGIPLLPATVGTAYTSSHVNFTLTDSGTNFAVNDTFTITVSGDGYVAALAPAAVDGTQEVCGVLMAGVVAPSDAEVSGLTVVRDAMVADYALVWPAGITTPQKATAVAQLKAMGIIVRQGV